MAAHAGQMSPAQLGSSAHPIMGEKGQSHVYQLVAGLS